MNVQTNCYLPKNLNIVIGSLGLGMKKVHWEYGLPCRSLVDDFIVKDDDGVIIGVMGHVWLQDPRTLDIYDYVHQEYVELTAEYECKVDFKGCEVIEGCHPLQLMSRGLVYCPAPLDVQKELIYTLAKIEGIEHCLVDT
jgi:hypothetical protein